MATAKKKAKKKKATQDAYTLTLSMGSDTFSSTGATVLDALMNLPRPAKIMMWGVVTLEHGGKKKILRLPPIRLKRLFYAPSMQAIQAKQLLIGLK